MYVFAYDIILVDALKDGVISKLDRRQKTFESKGFKISHTNMEYVNCNFSRGVQKDATPVRIEA